MEWIFLGVFLIFLIRRMTGSSLGKDKDDFAGESTASYFLLDEFIDKPSVKENKLDQREQPPMEEETEWFEEEFE